MKTNNKLARPIMMSALALAISGCASTSDSNKQKLDDSYLSASQHNTGTTQVSVNTNPDVQLVGTSNKQSGQTVDSGYTRISPLYRGNNQFVGQKSLADEMSDVADIVIAADNMPLVDFLHHVFGELLKTNYVLGEGVSNDTSPVSLNIQDQISPRQLYMSVEQMLQSKGIAVKEQQGMLYLHKVEGNDTGAMVFGYGRDPASVPQGIQVRQIVPMRYLLNTTTIGILREIAKVQTSVDIPQGILFVTGEYQQVVRALELLKILDAPGARSRHVGFLRLTYINSEEFVSSVSKILENEGIMSGPQGKDNRVAFVPLNQIGAVAVFASDQDFVDRVGYWAKQLDKPSRGSNAQYFVYTPKFARANDLGESVSALISGQSAGVREAAASSAERTAEIEGTQVKSNTTASSDTVRMVVDDRANSLIFYTSGSEYQALLPLIERLDVMPKQVMLEVVVMEVTLTDEFKYGVDMALSSGKFAFNNAFGAEDIGGSVIKWVSGDNSINAQALESNKWVNVLSKPTLLVRDGVSANIQVGTDIPVVGKTTTDPNTGVTRSIEYRKTGIGVTVTPTVNAQGVVIMEIEQDNSNQVDGGAEVEGNPQIFERSISTEVVAQSGQTVILGGLVSENTSDNNSGTPFLKDVPFLGGLFGTTTQSTVKTELVIMVTPKVIHRADEWDHLKRQFSNGLSFIEIPTAESVQ